MCLCSPKLVTLLPIVTGSDLPTVSTFSVQVSVSVQRPHLMAIVSEMPVRNTRQYIDFVTVVVLR